MEIPQLSRKEIEEYVLRAKSAPKRRALKILHEPGAEWNIMINFILSDSYMQPHFHPHEDKVEDIRVLEGKICVIFFNDQGKITETVMLAKDIRDHIRVPAFAWHTYVILSDYAVSYETMKGVYDPATWKKFATWAPEEQTPEAPSYLEILKQKALTAVL